MSLKLQGYLLSVMALRGGDKSPGGMELCPWPSQFLETELALSEPAARAKGSLGAWGTLGDFPRARWESQSHPDLTQSCLLLQTQS